MIHTNTFKACSIGRIMFLVWLCGLLFPSEFLSARAVSLPEKILQSAVPDWNDLITWLEDQRNEHQIPGMAVAVVQRDKMLLMETFGHTDREKKIPVGTDTIFPIGSSAKPFTSTLVAMLVTDGTMNWDDPITKYLPYFKLKIRSENTSDQVTIRDLLSHRTGFFFMELIQKAINWAQDPDFDSREEKDKCTRESLLRDAVEFEPIAAFREKHNYSNISMLAAAMASGEAAGMDWDTLMEKRMFEPLGMKRSTTSITQIRKGEEVATGHLKDGDEISTALLLNMDVISPAGGINSTILDMAIWLRFLLSEGAHEGKRLVGIKELRETWTKQVGGADVGGMLPGASYGLGWFITEWKGHTVVEHGGNALGYSAMVALIPDEGIGFVLLSNCLPNPLQTTLKEKVWDKLLQVRE
ncbi:MAG: serine hydrolase domain-containing protein [Planctomycetota bacterium]|jgi:CubicO group peptidase (beta-lactamase class C family)